LLSAKELTLYIRGCTLNERESQKKIYNSFYGYAMSICDRYTNNQDDALEILNDGYLKIFREIHRYQPSYADVIGSFKGWLRKIMVYTAIDHFRKQRKHEKVDGLDTAIIHLPAKEADACDKISYDEIILFIQQLSPAYRTVLNLFIIEGFSHEDIAEQLGISVGTSKSNLSKARKQLQKILYDQNKVQMNDLIMGNAG
jgi:RNA polymerase sigma factor (sigma-70 family)